MPVFGPTKWITDVLGIPFMMQAWWNLCICSTIFVVTSLLTPRPDPAVVENLTWPNSLHVILHGKRTGLTDPRILAAVLTGIMVALYVLFQ